MTGSRKDLLRASANRTLLPIQQPSELRDPRWDQPQGIPQHEHLETGPSGTSRGIFQWKHPPGSAFTWETTQTASACRSPSLLPPHPPGPRSRCQDSSTLHCAGRDQPLPAGRSCGHPTKLATPKRPRRRRGDKQPEKSTPRKNNAAFGGRDRPRCRARPRLSDAATAAEKGTAEECGHAGVPRAEGGTGEVRVWERGLQGPRPFRRVVASFWLRHLEI